jgi:single-stranded-DNA-specific exonuclease
MSAAVAALSGAIDRRDRVIIHGDYDADGITATALMLLGLRDCGVEAEWYLPNRFHEGYGLSRGAVETIAAKGPGLLVTVDCGVNYPDEVALAKSLGLDVVVIDHHQPGPVLPDCHLVHEAVGSYPHGDLCGVGLALKVMHALLVERGAADRATLPAELDRLLDLVAIGTIADLAPLRGENRYYVKEGLKLLGIGHRAGLRALASVAACTGSIDSGTVAYRLAPRLNAAGRLADPSPPLRLLLTEDEDEARALAVQLHELNGARQDVERQILDQAVAQVEALSELPPVLVLAEPLWHEGVVGIVASRLVERYHRPTILLGVRDGVAKGSGRSIPAYDLMDGLNACASHLTVYGGHKQAAGLTLEAERVGAFRSAIEEQAASCLQAGDLVAVYQADAVLRGEDVNADTALALGALGPFGTGNPRPRVLLVDASLERAETTRNGAHLRCTVEVDGVRARGIGFGLGPVHAASNDDGARRVLGAQFRVDEWQGSLRPEFLLERIGPSVPVQNEPGEALSGGRGASAHLRGPAGDGRATTAAQPVSRLPACHDLRGGHGRASAVAQVLASGEQTAILTCSAVATFEALRQSMPFEALAGEATCFTRGSCAAAEASARSRTSFVEWEVAREVLKPWPAHVVAADPPYRHDHLQLLHQAADSGSIVHLIYGEEERQATASALRYLVHPRFAMVCVYRAMQEGQHDEQKLFARAVDIARKEARVTLSRADLVRAAGTLAELGVGRESNGEAKLDARSIPAYMAAEADYEECSRLCLNL